MGKSRRSLVPGKRLLHELQLSVCVYGLARRLPALDVKCCQPGNFCRLAQDASRSDNWAMIIPDDRGETLSREEPRTRAVQLIEFRRARAALGRCAILSA